MLRIYRGIGPGTILVMLITALLIWGWYILNPSVPWDSGGIAPMPLYDLFTDLLKGREGLSVLTMFLVVLIIAIYMVSLNTRLFFINERTFLPGGMFILLTGYLPGLRVCNAALLATLFLIIALDRIIGTYRKPGVAYNFFDASLLISIGSLFYFNLIWFWLLVIIGILIIRRVSLAEIVISIIGVITPYLALAAYYYVSGRDLSILTETIVTNLNGSALEYYWSPMMIVVSIINLLILVAGLLYLVSKFNIKKVRSRKTFSLLIWWLVITVSLYFLSHAVSVEISPLFYVPVSYILTHFLIFIKNKKAANILFTAIIISVIILNFL